MENALGYIHYSERWWLSDGSDIEAQVVESLKLFTRMYGGEAMKASVRAYMESEVATILAQDLTTNHPGATIVRKRSYWEDPTVQ